MYLQHYGLRELPFSLTPDTQFFFEYGHYRDALDTLKVALAGGEGFIKVTGEVGTGKTLLCRKLLNSLERKAYYTAYIPNPFLAPSALTLALADELGLTQEPDTSQHRVIKDITRRLIQLHTEGKKVVLLIDEAQAMPGETLDALRLLTNLETEKRKLLQVVLFGQPELDERLAEHAFRQLRQRITFSYRLAPIDRQALEAYVTHRLLVAGAQGNVRFASDALDALHQFSAGIPRLINILSHKALMAGYGQGQKDVSRHHVELAARDTEYVAKSGQPQRRLGVIVLGLLFIALVATLAWRQTRTELRAEGKEPVATIVEDHPPVMPQSASGMSSEIPEAPLVDLADTTAGTMPDMPADTWPGSPEGPGVMFDAATVTMNWSAVTGATEYTVSVRDMMSRQLVIDTTTTRTTHSAALPTAGVFRWNVAACNSAGCSGYTKPLYFRTSVSPSVGEPAKP